MQFWHGGGVHSAAAGEVITINPGEVHDGRSGSPGGCRYRMLYVERAAIDQLIETDMPRIRNLFALSGPVLRDAHLAQYVRHLHQSLEAERGDSVLALEQQSHLIQVLSLLFSRYGRPRLSLPDAAVEKRCVGRAKEYMIERLGEPVRLSDLAQAVGLSPFYLLRTFKLATGMRPTATSITYGWRGPRSCCGGESHRPASRRPWASSIRATSPGASRPPSASRRGSTPVRKRSSPSIQEQPAGRRADPGLAREAGSVPIR